MAFTVVTVTGTYTNADGSPAKGIVTFFPSTLMANSAGDRMSPTARVKVELDANGSLSIPLFATDDADTLPIGGTYTIVERISNADERVWRTAIPSDSGTIDLADLAPVNTPPYISYSPVGHSHTQFEWIDGWMTNWLQWPEEMRTVETALSEVTSNKVRIAIIGDDAPSGAGATDKLNGLSGQLAQRLEVFYNGVNASRGYFGADELSPTGGVASDQGIDGRSQTWTAAGGIDTTQTAAGVAIFHDASQTGDWRYQFDSGGWTTVSNTGASVPGKAENVYFTSVGSHQLEIEWVSGTVIIEGVQFTGIDPTGAGLEVLDGAVANETTTVADDAVRTASYEGNGVSCVFIMAGYRDLVDAVPQETYATNLANIITKLRAENPLMSVVVVAYWEFETTDEPTWASWRETTKTVAEANASAFIDLYNLMGSTDPDPHSYTSDGDELVDLGHAYIGLGLAQFVTASPTQLTVPGGLPPVDTANFVKKNDDNTYDANKVQTHPAAGVSPAIEVTDTGSNYKNELSPIDLEIGDPAADFVKLNSTGVTFGDVSDAANQTLVLYRSIGGQKLQVRDAADAVTEVIHADATADAESATKGQMDTAISSAVAALIAAEIDPINAELTACYKKVQRTADQTIQGTGSFYAVSFQIELDDNGWGSGTGTTYTVPRDGRYSLTFNPSWDGYVADTFQTGIKINSTNWLLHSSSFDTSLKANETTVAMAFTLSATDTIEFMVAQNSGTTRTLDNAVASIDRIPNV